MTAYSVSGTLTPDATILNNGEPDGTYNGYPYWTWTAPGGTFHLWQPNAITKAISGSIGSLVGPLWIRNSPGIAGTYSPSGGATGALTLAEYVPSTQKILILEILVGPNAGKYHVLKEA